MTRYTATATRDEAGFWIAIVDGVDGVHTNARRLDQLPARLAEALSLAVDDPVPDDIDLHVDLAGSGLPDGVCARVAQATQARRRLADLEAETAAVTRGAVRDLAAAGLSVRDVGTIVGLTHQRVQQILHGHSGHASRRSARSAGAGGSGA